MRYNLKRINNDTKQASNFLRNYHFTPHYIDSLSKVYGRCSEEKLKAESDCRELMRTLNGYDFRICGHNSSHFTCGFLFVNNDGVIQLVYCTHANTYVMDYR